MGLTSLLNKDVSVFGIRPGFTYKTLLICSAPVALCAYLYYNKKQTSSEEPKSPEKVVPKTPLELSVSLKDKGNKYFKAGEFESAIKCYSQAIETCPEGSKSDLATFYQNRAAAKENLNSIESAIEDCTMALKYSPRYLKALNRRAKLHERTSQPYLALLDVTAATIFESFSCMENVVMLERILTQIAAQSTETQKTLIKFQLPANSFIRNYFSAFDWDPLLCDPTELMQSSAIFTEASNLFETLRLPYDELQFCKTILENPQNQLGLFLGKLFEAITDCREGNYEESFKASQEAVDLAQPLEDLLKCRTSEIPSGKIIIFIALAKLLKGTYKALSGQANEAHLLLDDVVRTHTHVNGIDSIMNGDDKLEWGKHPMTILIRVNALIKKACLIMTSAHDVAACLSAFQEAEQLCSQCPDLYLHRGQIFILTDQYDEALNNLNKAIKLQPNSSVARCQRIFASYRKAFAENDFERAFSRVDDFKKLISKYPKCIETRSLYAQILSERMEYTQADEEFEQVLRISPDSGIFYGHRAMMHLRWKQDRASAKGVLEDGLKHDQKCGMLHELLAQLSIESGDFDIATYHLERAIELSTSEAELRHLIALQTGAKAQKEVCQIYGISKEEINAWHLTCQERMMSALQSR